MCSTTFILLAALLGVKGDFAWVVFSRPLGTVPSAPDITQAIVFFLIGVSPFMDVSGGTVETTKEVFVAELGLCVV